MAVHGNQQAAGRRRTAADGGRGTRSRGMLGAALVGGLAVLALTATPVTAQAAPIELVGVIGTGPAATCHYQVNHYGGIYIYKQNAVGAYWGSLANGATFYSNCNNGGGEPYDDCPGGTARMWKAVNAAGGNTGYVKTKCLVRI
mgnify:CR=1 FL=1